MAWPAATAQHDRSPQIRHNATLSYADAMLADTTLEPCRLRYPGSTHHWHFAIYRNDPTDTRRTCGRDH